MSLTDVTCMESTPSLPAFTTPVVIDVVEKGVELGVYARVILLS